MRSREFFRCIRLCVGIRLGACFLCTANGLAVYGYGLLCGNGLCRSLLLLGDGSGIGHNLAAVNLNDALVEVLDKGVLVRDHQHGGAALVDGAEQIYDLVGKCRVDVAGRLVRDDHGGVIDKGARKAHTLAFAAGHFELQVTLFRRTNKGVTLTPEGEEFLGYARQVNSQLDLMRERYFGGAPVRRRFCVSTQHYSFAVEAFVALLKEHGGETYDFHLRETQTYEIIEDVALLKSEVGVLYLSPFNETVLKKTIKAHGLGFHLLFKAQPHVFLGAENPLAKRKSITLEDLAPYPRLSYEQGDHNAFYFSEEIQSTLECAKDIHVCDRATLFNLLIGLNGYTICSGVINESLNGKNIVAVPLNLDDYMEIGYLTRENVEPSLFAQYYIDALKKFTMQ